jgi:anti-anti-sigma factor
VAFRVEENSGDRGFRLVGELDMASADRLIERLRSVANWRGDLWLDLAELEFMDSAGIQALIAVGKELGEGQRLVLRSPRGEVSRILQLVGAHRFPNVAIEQDGAIR